MSVENIDSILWEMEHPEYGQVLDYIRKNPSITICELWDKMYYTEKRSRKYSRPTRTTGH